METETTKLYDEFDIISFSRYILSDLRTKRITDTWNPADGIPLQQRLNTVYHADIENWKSDENARDEVKRL